MSYGTIHKNERSIIIVASALPRGSTFLQCFWTVPTDLPCSHVDAPPGRICNITFCIPGISGHTWRTFWCKNWCLRWRGRAESSSSNWTAPYIPCIRDRTASTLYKPCRISGRWCTCTLDSGSEFFCNAYIAFVWVTNLEAIHASTFSTTVMSTTHWPTATT